MPVPPPRPTLQVLPLTLAICRLPVESPLPAWALASELFSVTRTASELSVVCEVGRVPDGILREQPWRVLQVQGPLDFSLTGVMAALAGTLAEAGISLFAISTYDTDYVLVRAGQLDAAVDALRSAGHKIG